MTQALADLTVSLRTLGNDTATSNLVVGENVTGSADGSNTKFRLQNIPVVTASVYLSYGSTFRTTAGFAVDLVNGIVTFTAPPALNTVISADYDFYWFPDASYTEFLNDGARMLLGGGNDPATVSEGLIPALLQYGLYFYWIRRASQYANKYSSTGGQAGQSVETVTGNFLKLASTAMKMAAQARDDFYKRQGQREAPSSAVITYGMDPFTPQR